MAKARFQKHQRVFVRPVGIWAAVEAVKPQWVKDLEEPVNIFYDCGLGRDFSAEELAEEERAVLDAGRWRLMRAKNQWQSEGECAHYPVPGTFPVVVTDEKDWGGWRVPAAEYDRDPARIEAQARLIAAAPRLLTLAETLARAVSETPEAGGEIAELARRAKALARTVRAEAGEHGVEAA